MSKKVITVILDSPRYGVLTLLLPTVHYYDADIIINELSQYGTVSHTEIRCTNIFDLRDLLISYNGTLGGNLYCASPLYLGVSTRFSTKLNALLLKKGIYVSHFETTNSETYFHFLGCQQLHDSISHLANSLLSPQDCPLFF